MTTPSDSGYLFDEESAHISRNEQEEINADAENLASLYCLIPLTKGQFAIVDAADYKWLNQWKWYAMWSKKTNSYYAARDTPMVNRKRGKTILMHRQILGLDPGDKRKGDHIESGRTLFNVRSNLRIAPNQGNSSNSRLRHNSRSGYKGVYWSNGKWRARITINGVTKYICTSADPAECHKRYCEEALKNFGDFARFK